MEQTDLTELIGRARQGDPDAQSALVRMTQNRVYYHCRKMLKKEEDAQDATQDVLLAMLTGLDKLREPAAFWGWVNGITANRCRHLLSAPHREWQIPEDEEGNSMLDSVEEFDEHLVPDKALDNEETRRMILDLVDSLPPEQRMCVLFYYYDEMSVKEIAQAMDVSEGTVKSRLNYARRTIKRGVEEYERKGIKLYSLSPAVLLVYFLRQEAASVLEESAAASLAARVLSQAGGAAAGTAAEGAAAGSAAEGAAAGSAAEGAAAGAAAEGAAAGSTAAGAAAGTAAKAGLSAKLIAGIVAGAVIVGGAAVGIPALTNRDAAPSATPSVSLSAAVETPEPTGPLPFGEIHGFPISEPQAYEGLPVLLLLNDPSLVALPSACAATQPVLSVSGPDESGYVAYTVTYDLTAQSHLGDADGGALASCSILAQEYNLYDYYTGRLYLPEGPETGASGETRASGSAEVEHGGETFTIFYEKSWVSSMTSGDWTGSTQPGLVREMVIDSAMSIQVVVRVPEDYDGVLLGLNVVDPADPEKEISEDWNLETDDPSHYRFFRLSDAR